MNSEAGPTFELPGKLEKIFASLATFYAQNDNTLLQSILVNSRYHVQEQWSYDNWDGGTFGHAVYFRVPAPIFYSILKAADATGRQLRDDINQISNVQNEFIEEVFLELQDDSSLEDWREQSGVLLQSTTVAAIGLPDQLQNIWNPGFLRLFVSHKASYKEQASQFKKSMDYFGVSCFVAHEDIKPTKKWQIEIEKALFSMDALVALMTKDFASSSWTDQEVGVAIGRQVPVISIRLGTDPYGFIGKYQGLPGASKSPSQLAQEVYDLLWKMPELVPNLTDSLVKRFETALNYHHANGLIRCLARVEQATPDQIDRLARAQESNRQVADAWSVQEDLPKLLKRFRGNQ